MIKFIKNILRHQDTMKKRLKKNFLDATEKDIDLDNQIDLDKILCNVLNESEESLAIRQNLKDYDDKYIKDKVGEIVNDLSTAANEGRSFILSDIKPRNYETIKLILVCKGFHVSIFAKSIPFGSEESLWTVRISI